jgi:hypothetical protein
LPKKSLKRLARIKATAQLFPLVSDNDINEYQI